MGASKAIITTGILLLILAIPTFLFIFLFTFGENEFAIPVYYQEGVIISREGCSWPSGPYEVPDFEVTGQGNSKITSAVLQEKLSIIHFVPAVQSSEQRALYSELTRLLETFQENPSVQLLSLFSSTSAKPSSQDRFLERWLLLSGEAEAIAKLASCGFILPSTDFPKLSIEHQLVLVDGKKHIRGYYDSRKKEEVDRLITEIEILKTESEHEQQ